MYGVFESIFEGINKLGTEGFTNLFLIVQLSIFGSMAVFQAYRIMKEMNVMKCLKGQLAALHRGSDEEVKNIDIEINAMFNDLGKSKYKELWSRYYSRVNNKEEDERIRVEPFFGFDVMHYHMGYRPLMDVGAGLSVSIGVLGTFIGLSVGLADLNITGDSEVLREGIGGLISGMKVAFYTSVFGVMLSLCWTAFDRIISSRLDNEIDWHSERLDYLLSTDDEELFLNRMEKISRNQADHLKTLLTDALEKVMQPMVLGLQQSNGQVSNAFNDLKGQFSSLEEGMTLQSQLLASQVELTKNNSQNMTDSLVEQITGGTEKTISDFGNLITDTQQMQHEMMRTIQQVVTNFAQSEQHQANTFKQTEAMVEQFGQTMGSMTEMRQGFKEMSDFIVDIQGSFQAIQQMSQEQLPIQNEVMKSNQQLAQKYDRLSESFTQFNKEAEEKYEELLQKVVTVSTTMASTYKEMTSRFEKALSTQEHTISESDRLLSNIKRVVEELTPIAPDLKEVVGNIASLRDQLYMMQQVQTDLLPELVSMREQTNETVEKALNTTKTYTENMNLQINKMQDNWETTRTSFGEINKQLGTSIKDFSENIDTGLSKTYQHFDETLTNAVTQVSHLINQFRDLQEEFVDSLEDLSESIEKTTEVMKR